MTGLTKNARSFFHTQMLWFKYIGLWRPEKRSLIYDLFLILALSVQFSVVLFILIYVVIVWGDLDAVSQGCYVLFTQVSTCLKMSVIVLRKKTLLQLTDHMNDDIFLPQSLSQEQILDRQSRKMKYLFMSLLLLVTVGVTQWVLSPYLSEGPKAFPFIMWMPVDPESSPGFELGYTYQLIFSFMGSYSYMTVDAVIVTMTAFGSAQLDVIKDKLLKIKNVRCGMKQTERVNLFKEHNKVLDECVRHHQAVVSYIGSVEKLFNVPIFFQMSGSVLIVCVIAFRLSVEPINSPNFYSSVLYLASMLVPLYCYCWNGNELTSRCQELRDEMYNCPWYEQDTGFKRKLWIAMECMKKPIVFQSGYYIKLSRPTFVAILRCSYSYFAVLNQANSS